MISHLYDTYTCITPNALKENDKQLHQTYDPSLPLDTLVDQVEDAVDFAAAGKYPCTTKHIVTAGHDLIHDTGTCDAYCKDWRSLKPIEQNWDNFKRFFSKANHDVSKSQALSETQVTAIVCQANSVNQDLDQSFDHEARALEDIANLAVARSEDK